MAETKLNSEAIQTLAKENPTADSLLLTLAERGRNRGDTDIQRYRLLLLRKGVKVVEADYLAAWKKLEEIGAGSIIYGRKNKSNRFKWNYSLRAVGLAAHPATKVEKEKRNRKKKEVKAKRGRPKKAVEVDQKPSVEKHTYSTVLYIPLRKDKAIQISVPNDFTQEEARTISNALLHLAKSA